MAPRRATRFWIVQLFCGALIAATALPAIAQPQPDPQQPPPAYIASIEGNATLERDGDVQPAVLNMPLVAGDRLRTTTGRVEIRFADGTGIELAADSEIEMLTATRVRLLAGTLDHLEAVQPAGDSSAYLPQDLQMYGNTFDQYGSWQNTTGYGYVWYPQVAPDWRPYYNGYWDAVPSYGWTWIGFDRWAWPTHHYGRWGYAGSRWFWIPGRSFAPAWVSWGAANGFVSWCPLGFDNRAVFAMSAGFRGWNGWTVVPRSNFGVRGAAVNRFAVEPRHLSSQLAFITQNTPPVAVPRDRRANVSAPAAAGVAVPRARVYSTADLPTATGGQRDYRRRPPTVVDPARSTTGRVYSTADPSVRIDQPGVYRRVAPTTQNPTTPGVPPTPRVATPRNGQPAGATDPAPYRRGTYRVIAPSSSSVPPQIGTQPAAPAPQPRFGTPPMPSAPPSHAPYVLPRYMPPAPSAPSQPAQATPPRAASPPPSAPPPAAHTPQRSAPSTSTPARSAQPRSGGESHAQSSGSRHRG